MDVNQITQIIMNIGFPIVMCGAMAWYVKYITDKHNAEMDEERKAHREEVDALKTMVVTYNDSIRDAIANNTNALTRLCEKLDK